MELTDEQRQHFDAILEEVLAELPPEVTNLFDEVPLVVDDYPSRDVMRRARVRRADHLCGLHTGVPLTERDFDAPYRLPDTVNIYRLGILTLAAGDEDELRRQIRITILHEYGHHFGLDEDDLDELGYG